RPSYFLHWPNSPRSLHSFPTRRSSDLLITAIRDRGRFLSDEQATAAAAAVLGVLSTRDLGGEAERLAAQLPDGIGELLLAEERAVERFDSEEFLHRIQQRLGGSAADAELAT